MHRENCKTHGKETECHYCISTVEKWKQDYNKSLQMCLWSEFDKMGREYVSALKYKACKQFNGKIQST